LEATETAADGELDARHGFGWLLSDLSARFVHLPAEAVTDEIGHALGRVCRALGVDRCSFYECTEDGRTLLLVRAFAIDGDASEVPDNLTQSMPWLAERLLAGRLMAADGAPKLPAEAVPELAYSQRHRIRAGIAIPISVGGLRLCALVATGAESRHAWSETLVGQLRLLGEIFAGALARKRGDEALRRSEDRFRDLAEASADWFWETDGEFRLTYVSERLTELSGLPRERLLGRTNWELAGAAPEQPVWRAHVALLRSHRPFRDFRFALANGEGRRYWSLSGKPVFDRDGGFVGYRGAGRDATESALSEAELKESVDRIRDFAEAVADWFWETDAEHRFTYLTGASDEPRDVEVDAALGHRRFDWERFDGEPEKWRRHREDLAARRPFRHFRYKYLRNDGTVQYFSVSGRPFHDADGRFRGYRGTSIDVTAETEASNQLSDAFDSMTDGVIICDREERIVNFNRAFRAMYSAMASALTAGLRYGEFMRLAVAQGIIACPPERADEWLREWMERFRSASGVAEVQFNDGRWVQVVDRRTENGYTVGRHTDVSVPKQREEQLRQARKMEAIGQLTGGIAHDFNNLLAIIQGNISYLERQLAADSPLQKLTAPALRAARRGASLTHRLLAFSRQQPLQDRVVDAGELLLGMQDLLYRSLGEQVRLEIVPEPGLWSCLVDPVQLEHAILNLAINARDAMPNGGRLLIEVSNAELSDNYAAALAEVHPGAYVAIAVSDTGEGMTPEVKARIFEPFFTTKAIGKGSGLGLSMVFGFVKQSRGHLTVYSEPGLGSTFKIYLPRSDRPSEQPADAAMAIGALPAGDGQVILVVEDDRDVRQMAAMLLRGLDYRVCEAGDARVALRILEREPAVDLLLTDVVLATGVDGVALAAIARQRRAGLKVLFMSAKPPEIVSQSRLPANARLLRKPFEPDELARVVAGILGTESRR
jgi:PAS domain S-box-containing protein